MSVCAVAEPRSSHNKAKMDDGGIKIAMDPRVPRLVHDE
jgi:hypothetical protein